MPNFYSHPSAFVDERAKIGEGTKIWHGAQVREGATIGKNCILGKNAYVDKDVVIGNNVKIQNNASVNHGATLEDGVFIGPHVVILNDKYPRAITPEGNLKTENDWCEGKVTIKEGASIGANATIFPNVTIGKYALIGACSAVVKDVPDNALAYGNPAKVVGSVCKCGLKIKQHETCSNCGFSSQIQTKTIPIAKPLIGDEEKKAVCSVLDSGMLAQGPKVKEFEESFANFIGTKFAVATSSGTTALCAALHGLGIKQGDEVITTSFTFIATSNSILDCGAKPVFVDIDPKTFNIDPKKIIQKITPNTKALLIVHLFGQSCDVQPILDICKKHSLKLIEDCCQAHGAEYLGKKVGSFGDCGVFSFYPTKNMTTCEGGMIVTNDEKLKEACKLYRDHGSKVRYYHETIGFNLRMTDVSAAIGIVQLKKLNQFNQKRIEHAAKLTNGLKSIKGLITPHTPPNVLHVFNQYTIRVSQEFSTSRDALIEKLKAAGIGANIYYPVPIHKQPFYQKLGYADTLPETEKAAQEVLSIPVHPSLSEQDVNLIVSTLANIK